MRLTDIDRSNAGYCSKKVPFSRLGHSIRPCFARKTPDVVSETAITDGRPGAEDPAMTGVAAHGEAGGRLTAAATDWRVVTDTRDTRDGAIDQVFAVLGTRNPLDAGGVDADLTQHRSNIVFVAFPIDTNRLTREVADGVDALTDATDHFLATAGEYLCHVDEMRAVVIGRQRVVEPSDRNVDLTAA